MQLEWSAAASTVAISVPEFPLEEPVLVFTIALAVFLIGPLVVRRLGQPGIIGVVLLGAILGPGGVGLVAHSDAIVLLGEVGLIYLLLRSDSSWICDSSRRIRAAPRCSGS